MTTVGVEEEEAPVDGIATDVAEWDVSNVVTEGAGTEEAEGAVGSV